jgi:hypothetical protein
MFGNERVRREEAGSVVISTVAPESHHVGKDLLTGQTHLTLGFTEEEAARGVFKHLVNETQFGSRTHVDQGRLTSVSDERPGHFVTITSKLGVPESKKWVDALTAAYKKGFKTILKSKPQKGPNSFDPNDRKRR